MPYAAASDVATRLGRTRPRRPPWSPPAVEEVERLIETRTQAAWAHHARGPDRGRPD